MRLIDKHDPYVRNAWGILGSHMIGLIYHGQNLICKLAKLIAGSTYCVWWITFNCSSETFLQKVKFFLWYVSIGWLIKEEVSSDA